MPTRREASEAHRRAHHRALVGTAATATTRLWRACNWLIATAKHHDRLDEALAVVRDLIDRLEAGEPLRPALEPEPPAVNGPQTPWYLQVRAPATSDRRDDVA